MKMLIVIQLPMPWITLSFLLELLHVLAWECNNDLDNLRPLTQAFSNLAIFLWRVTLSLLCSYFITYIVHIHVLPTTWSNFHHSDLTNIKIGLVESSYLHLKASSGQDPEPSWNQLLIQRISLETLLLRKIQWAEIPCRRKFSRKTNAWTCSLLIGKA